ncbi:ribonuclease P protein component 4 [Acidianus sp. HS-5]|uniref:ribonuclease P protein component 4 n=1 Tax=Acidianus sp. HS-5 TaxID=2886040 RepID=UPI001F2949EF|nr:ribonuclease P protein component 4 [Acidianus sp. HS-5]BDC18326.1 ribonuclease P [Acidianus sp. HS-5]
MNKKALKKRALRLIDDAVKLAEEGNLELARKYVLLAREYSNKGRFKIPIEYKRTFCRKCLTPLIPGRTERIRIKSKILVRSCLICGWIRRYDLRKSKESKSRTPSD